MTVQATITDNAATQAYVVQPSEGELRWMGATSTRFLATGDATAGLFCLVDETAIRGESVPLHRHSEDVESFFVLEGEISFFLGDEACVRSGPSSFVHIPAGTVHGFRVESDKAHYLILTTPRHGDFYRAITRPSGPDGKSADGPVDGATIKEACKNYGIEFVGPLPD